MKSRERQMVFFTAVNPMEEHLYEQKEFDLTKPSIAAHKQKWKVQQDSVYWGDIMLTQRKGLTFYRTRSHAIILNDTLLPFCIERMMSMKTNEVLHKKQYLPPRPALTVTLKANWQKPT